MNQNSISVVMEKDIEFDCLWDVFDLIDELTNSGCRQMDLHFDEKLNPVFLAVFFGKLNESQVLELEGVSDSGSWGPTISVRRKEPLESKLI